MARKERFALGVWVKKKFIKEDFSNKRIPVSTLKQCTFINCRFNGAFLQELHTISCLFQECDFKGATMNSSIHQNSAFPNCCFDEANLFVAQFIDCKMTGSTFVEADFSGITIKGGDWSYTLLRNHRLKRCDLSGVLFKEANLYKVDFEESDLRNSDLSYASISGVSFRGADLRGARLDGLDLKNVNLKGARIDLSQAIQLALSHGAKVE